jgi:hypothetical protein
MEGGSLLSQKQRATLSLAPLPPSLFKIRMKKVTSPGEDRWRESKKNCWLSRTAGPEGERLLFRQ